MPRQKKPERRFVLDPIGGLIELPPPMPWQLRQSNEIVPEPRPFEEFEARVRELEKLDPALAVWYRLRDRQQRFDWMRQDPALSALVTASADEEDQGDCSSRPFYRIKRRLAPIRCHSR